MDKVYNIKKTKKLIKQLQPYWKQYNILRDEFYAQLYLIEKEMELITGIKGIEFFFCDNECAGIGNADRTMTLIHDRELEK